MRTITVEDDVVVEVRNVGEGVGNGRGKAIQQAVGVPYF